MDLFVRTLQILFNVTCTFALCPLRLIPMLKVCNVIFFMLAILSGPVLAMVLEKPDAIAQRRALIGPTDARKAKTSHPNRLNATLFPFFFPVKILHMTSIIFLVNDGKGKQLLAIVIRDAFCTNSYSIF